MCLIRLANGKLKAMTCITKSLKPTGQLQLRSSPTSSPSLSGPAAASGHENNILQISQNKQPCGNGLCTSSSANLGKLMVGQEHLFRAKYLLNLLGPQGRPRDPRRPCPNEWHQSQRQHTSRTPSAAGGEHGNCASMSKPCASHGAKAMIPPMARNSAFLE